MTHLSFFKQFLHSQSHSCKHTFSLLAWELKSSNVRHIQLALSALISSLIKLPNQHTFGENRKLDAMLECPSVKNKMFNVRLSFLKYDLNVRPYFVETQLFCDLIAWCIRKGKYKGETMKGDSQTTKTCKRSLFFCNVDSSWLTKDKWNWNGMSNILAPSNANLFPFVVDWLRRQTHSILVIRTFRRIVQCRGDNIEPEYRKCILLLQN